MLTAAQQKYFDTMSTMKGQGTPDEMRSYAASLQDVQAYRSDDALRGDNTYKHIQSSDDYMKAKGYALNPNFTGSDGSKNNAYIPPVPQAPSQQATNNPLQPRQAPGLVASGMSQQPPALSPGASYAAKPGGIGDDKYLENIRTWATANGGSTNANRLQEMDKWGITEEDWNRSGARLSVATNAPQQATVATNAPQQATVANWSVAPNQTVQQQLSSVIAADGPLMQQARANAQMQANERGLINSSMAVGAGHAAMMDRAIEIGSRDASTYAQAGQFNADSANRSSMFNASESNANNRFNTTNTLETDRFNASESNANNRFNTTNTLETDRFNVTQSNDMNRLNAEQVGADRRILLAAEADIQRIAKTMPGQFASNLSATAMSSANAIIADGNLNAEQKKAAIDNVIGYANSQVDWANAFYKADIPKMTAPAK